MCRSGLVAASVEVDGKRVLRIIRTDLDAAPAQQALLVVPDVHRIVILDRLLAPLRLRKALVRLRRYCSIM